MTTVAKTRANQITRSPDVPPPALRCPTCRQLLDYRHTIFASVRPHERWDYFTCERCEVDYDYRHRTKRLRRTLVPADERSYTRAVLSKLFDRD